MFYNKYPPTSPGTQKHRGSIALFLVAILFVVSVICTSLATIAQATFSSSSSSKITLQALQYADAKSEIIKATKYEELTAHERTTINNSIYQDEVIVGPETTYPEDEDILQKVCTINVYRLNEEYPRYSLKVVRTSVSLDNSVPVGSIIPYKGNLADIPDNWVLCDGKNGTPDLRDRFITGAGNIYSLDDTGGENEVLLEANQQASHYHSFGHHNGNNNGYFISTASRFELFQRPTNVATYPAKWNGDGGGGYWSWDGGSSFGAGQNLVTSLAKGVDAAKPHENRPPYYAVYYIMKIK